MSRHKHIPNQVIRSAYALVEKMPPLRARKDPRLAALAGLALGGIGLGLYFGTMVDFLVPLCIWITLVIFSGPTGGLLLIAAPVFTAIFGYKRAVSSNARLQGNDSEILTAEVVSEPTQIRTAGLLPSPLRSRLQRLDDLLREGILTPSEHAQKRTQILHEP